MVKEIVVCGISNQLMEKTINIADDPVLLFALHSVESESEGRVLDEDTFYNLCLDHILT